jgi:transposase
LTIAAMPAEQPPMIPQATTLEEAQALIHDLWLKLIEQSKRMEEMAKRIVELEEKLGTNSRNSSKPPSTENHKVSNKKSAGSGKKAGGQPGHQGKGRTLFTEDQITHTQACYPHKQCDCGGEVKTTRLNWRHQTIDIPEIKPHITEYRLYAGACQGCGKQHEAGLPTGVSASGTCQSL